MDGPRAAPDRDLTGRIVLITGATSGIGRVATRALGRRGARLFLACRDVAAARALAAEIDAENGGSRGGGGGGGDGAEVLACELGDLSSVRACARAFLARGLPLHTLINNAGLAGTRGLTKDGFELAFGVNHLGHFLLTSLLQDALRAGAPARVVTVASRAHRRARGIDFAAVRRPTASRTGIPEYGVAKLCNILFSRELGRRLAGSGITTYSLHPGVVATRIWREVPAPARWLMNLFMISPEEGARTILHCAASPALGGETGRYYADCLEATPTAVAADDDLAARLWTESERFVADAGG